MSLYKHLTLKEREMILKGLLNNLSYQEISQKIGCSKSTISREISRNGGKENYSIVNAQRRYIRKRKNCHRPRILSEGPLRDLVIRCILLRNWSPEQISNRLKHEGKQTLSYNTIYRAIYKDNLGIKLESHGARGIALKLRHGGKSRHTKTMIDNRGRRFWDAPSIHSRPRSVQNRSRFGHWEADTVRGKTGKAALITLVDRKSRFLLAQRVEKVNSKLVCQGIIELLGTVSPNKVLSITPDRGSEFTKYKEFREVLGVKVYFPDPHSPHQRGTNENTNGLLREYFPRNIDIDKLSEPEIEQVIDQLNHRPRKVLGWKSPYEVFYGVSLHLI